MVHAIRERFGGSSSSAELAILLLGEMVVSVGVVFPRRWCDRASDTPVANFVSPCASPAFAGAATSPYVLLLVGSYGSQDAELAKTTVDAFPWRTTPLDDPGCLLSTGTLRRIRWPLQPRSRDPHTAFGDGWTAGCRSLDTLSLRVDPLPPEAVSPTHDVPFARRALRRFTRRFSLRARPPFTRPWPLFLERVCRAYSRPDVAQRLLQRL